MSGNDLLLSGLKCAAVAILFAICGGWSASRCFPYFPPDSLVGLLDLFPVPFAVLCIVLFLHKVRAVCAAPMPIVWLVAYSVADFLGTVRRGDFVPGCVGGLVGGLGLVLCVSIGNRASFSLMRLTVGGLVGSISGWSFAPWVHAYYAYDLNRGPLAGPPTPGYAFAIWQFAMGTYLYGLSLVKRDAPVDHGR
jgi:hypothetical protein